MAAISKSFDVKIRIIRPFITKDLSFDDISKIKETTALKYETLQTTSPEGTIAAEVDTPDTEMELFQKEIERMDQIYDGFDALSKRAEKAMEKIVFTYDTSNPENEYLADAEVAIFGFASGIITLDKYKKVMAFEKIINRELQENMIESGGQLNVG